MSFFLCCSYVVQLTILIINILSNFIKLIKKNISKIVKLIYNKNVI